MWMAWTFEQIFDSQNAMGPCQCHAEKPRIRYLHDEMKVTLMNILLPRFNQDGG
jgi:hypothetical protein